MNSDPRKIAIDLLNDAYAADPTAVHSLFQCVVPVNDLLADHEHVIVAPVTLAGGERYTLSALGLINGLMSALGCQPIASRWDEHGTLIGFTSFPTSTNDGTPT